MAGSNISIKLDGLKALEKGLKTLPKTVPAVTAVSVNEAVDKMYTAAWRTIKPQFFLKQKYFSRAIKKVRANPSKPVGALVATGKHLALSRFKYSPTRPSKTRQPVSVMLGPGISAAVPAGIFVAVMPSGYKGVFKRVGKSRFPLEQPLSDVGPAEMLGNESIRKTLEIVGKEAFDKEFRRLTKVQMAQAFGNMPK